jgi:hypothetical protein
MAFQPKALNFQGLGRVFALRTSSITAQYSGNWAVHKRAQSYGVTINWLM